MSVLAVAALSPWFLLAGAAVAFAVAVVQLQRPAAKSVILRTAERARDEATGMLAESQATLAAIVSNNLAAIGVTRADGAEVLANDAYRSFFDLLRAAPEVEAWREGSVRAQGGAFREEFALSSGGRTRHFDTIKFPLTRRDGGVYATCAVVLDVTPQRRATQDLRLSNENLERFAHVASHDLREPLRTMAGYANLLERRCAEALDPEATRYLAAIRDAGARGMELIDDLLRLSHAATAKYALTDVPLDAVVDEALEALAALREETGALVEVGALPAVHVDRSRVRQVLQNLVCNAIAYVPDARRPHVRIDASRRGERVEVTVTDNGPGIPEDKRERVFETFTRLAPPDGPAGTGLGLALCQRVVERHGGRISVEPATGGGSVFRFTLPAAAGGA